MALYPTVPVCMQLTDYELETLELGVAPVYRTVPPPRPPSLYPVLYDVEPPAPTHGLPEYVALVGLHPLHCKDGTIMFKEFQNKSPLERDKLQTMITKEKEKDPTISMKLKEPTQQQSQEENKPKMVTKEVILNRRGGRLGLRVEVAGTQVLVSSVSRGGPAGQAGLRRGDQLISINKTQLSGLSQDKVHHVIRACPPVGIKLIFKTRKDSSLLKCLESIRKSLDEL